MDFDKYVQERWDGMLELLEAKKLNDYALGRAFIKFANSDHPINKRLQKRGEREAKKYEVRRDARLEKELYKIAKKLDNVIKQDIKANSELKHDAVGFEMEKIAVRMDYKFKPYNIDELNNKISRILVHETKGRDYIFMYDYGFTDNGKLMIKIWI